MLKSILLMTLTCLMAATHGLAQTREQDPGPPGSIRVETALVTVPVSVTDRDGKFVTGLTRADFELYENGAPQEIGAFSSTEEPFNVALLIDTSRSAKEYMSAIRKATRSFVDQLHPRDRVLIVTFGEQVNFHGDFTSDRGRLRGAIDGARNGELTSLYDAISRTITEKLAPLSGRKAIVVFSDGLDTCSQSATYESALELVARSGVSVYAVQYDNADPGAAANAPRRSKRGYAPKLIVPDLENSIRAEWERRRIATNFLTTMAEVSGARLLRADRLDNSERAFAVIADELRHQYTLEYYSTNDRHDGGYRAINVRLKREGLSASAKKGYRAPGPEGARRAAPETR
jgi:VWFA-related protein